MADIVIDEAVMFAKSYKINLNSPDKFINVLALILLISQHLSDSIAAEKSLLPLYVLICRFQKTSKVQIPNSKISCVFEKYLTFLSLSLFVRLNSSYAKVSYRKASVYTSFMQASIFKRLSLDTVEGRYHCKFISIQMIVLATSIENCLKEFAFLADLSRDQLTFKSNKNYIASSCKNMTMFPELFVCANTCLQMYE